MFPVLPFAVVMGALKQRSEENAMKRKAQADILGQRAAEGGAPNYGSYATSASQQEAPNYAGDMIQRYMAKKAERDGNDDLATALGR